MTKAKQHEAGQVAHIVQRTTQRQYLLHNAKGGKMKNMVGYVYALSANKHGQVPHAVTIMSNHTHLCQTDTTGDRSSFMQDFHSLVAKIANRYRRRRENLWSTRPPGDTWLIDTIKIVETMLYIWLNPVRAGLVERVKQWDHFQILPEHWGQKMTFTRPNFFREGDPNKPETIEIIPQPPPGFEEYELEDVVAYFEKRIAEEEQALMIARRKKNRRVMGMKKVYKLNPWSSPRKSAKRSTLNPRFAASSVELVEAAVEGLKSFWRAYKRRMEDLKKGLRPAFPWGTIQVVKRLNLECLPNDSPLMKYEPFVI